MIRNKILEYVYTSQVIESAFQRFIKPEEKEEFKHYIISIIANASDKELKKFQRAYERGEIDFLIYSIMRNQYMSNTSPWYRKHKGVLVNFDEFATKDGENYNSLITDKFLTENKFRKNRDYIVGEENVDEVMNRKVKIEKMSDEIKTILDRRVYYKKLNYEFFLRKQYHETLFEMHFFEGKSYMEIEKLTGISYHTIRWSVMETLKYIKENINYDNYITD